MFVCSVISYLEVSSRDLGRDNLIASDECVRLQSDNVFGGEYVDSRDYLIAIDERVYLQCDVIFGGNPGLPRLTRPRVYIELSLLNDICQNLGWSGPSNIKLNWYGLT